MNSICSGPFGANLGGETDRAFSYRSGLCSRNEGGALLSPAAFVYTAPEVKH